MQKSYQQLQQQPGKRFLVLWHRQEQMRKAAIPFRQTTFSTAPQEHRKEALLLEKRREHSLTRQEQRPKAHGLRTLRRIPL
jgi:hypothetical protein